MQLDALKLFCDVIRLQSFSRAAKENQVTQSRASQTVHLLEKHLGVTLIDRTQRPWKLTTAGKIYFEGCRNVLDQYTALENSVRLKSAEADAVVRVSSIYSVGIAYMKQFIEKFKGFHPHTQVHLEYLHPEKVYETVLNEEVDLGIISYPQALRGITVIPWRKERMVVVCPPEHALASQRAIPVSKLKNEKFVHFDRGLSIRRDIERFLKRHEITVEVVLEFDNIEALKRAVEAATGIAILPLPTLEREIRIGTLKAVPFVKEELYRPLGIIHRYGKKFGEGTSRFIEMLKQENQPTEKTFLTEAS